MKSRMTVNRMVAGSNPARGAKNTFSSVLFIRNNSLAQLFFAREHKTSPFAPCGYTLFPSNGVTERSEMQDRRAIQCLERAYDCRVVWTSTFPPRPNGGPGTGTPLTAGCRAHWQTRLQLIRAIRRCQFRQTIRWSRCRRRHPWCSGLDRPPVLSGVSGLGFLPSSCSARPAVGSGCRSTF
jgi:hypothetical protein